MGRYLIEYECTDCMDRRPEWVEAQSLEKAKYAVITCPLCQRDTEHKKMPGGTNSRYFCMDPHRS